MKKLLGLLILVILSSGCATKVIVPIENAPVVDDKATIVIFHEQGFIDNFEIFIDNEPRGFVTAYKPFIIQLEEGIHEFYTKVGMNVVDRITKMKVENGKKYFMKLWLDLGMWSSSIRIDKTSAIRNYRTSVPDDIADKLISEGKIEKQ